MLTSAEASFLRYCLQAFDQHIEVTTRPYAFSPDEWTLSLLCARAARDGLQEFLSDTP